MKNNTTNTHDHYQDSVIDVRIIEDFGIAVFCTFDAETSTLNVDNPMYTPADMVDAYTELFDRSVWTCSEDKDDCVKAFCDWLIENGCTREELGLEDDAK